MSVIALVGGLTRVMTPRTLDACLLPLVAFAAGTMLSGCFPSMLPTGLATGVGVVTVFALVFLGLRTWFQN